MKPATWVRVRQVFEGVVELPEHERAAFLARTCEGEPEIRGEVERLLKEDTRSSGFLERGVFPLLSTPATFPPGSRLGKYELLRVVASGGMGTVFEARQDRPQRTVALKTMRFGLVSPARLHRFQFEAEVLGTLRHPCIAQIYEASAHDAGGSTIPFFAMEFVPEAKDILTFARERDLGRDERIAIFLDVCEGVAHGHQKGVIHRDLKPGNLLVDGDGHPKVIDFGVARASDLESDDAAFETRAGMLVGTLQYMSPEQLEGNRDEVDVRSDIYALGCVLYELLVGDPPFDLEGLSIGAVLRTIRETEPHRPRALPEDLCWILFKALEKDAERRYASVNELRDDLTRFLRKEPVQAGRPGAGYRIWKFSRRHRFGLSAMAAVLAALGIGLVQSEIARGETVAALRVAEREASKAHGVVEFLRTTLSSASPSRGGDDVRVVTVLAEASRTVESESRRDPAVGAAIAHVLADSFHALGLYGRCSAHLQHALSYVDGNLSENDRFALATRATQARHLFDSGDLAGAERLTASILPIAREELGDDDPVTRRIRRQRGRSLAQLNRWEEAEEIIREDIESLERLFGESHEELLQPLNSLVVLLDRRGSHREQEVVAKRALAIAVEVHPPGHPIVQRVRGDLAVAYLQIEEWERAEQILREYIAWSREEQGRGHPNTMIAMNNLANALKGQGKHAEAAELLEEALEIADVTFGPTSLNTIAAFNNLSEPYRELGRLDDAEAAAREALALADGVLADDHDLILRVRLNLALAIGAQGRHEESRDMLGATHEVARVALGPAHPVTATILGKFAAAHEALGEPAEWVRLAEEFHRVSFPDGQYLAWSEEELRLARAALAALEEEAAVSDPVD